MELVLSEKEINEDLKRNLVGLKVNLDVLVDEKNTLIPLRREDVIRNYSCGYYLREFILHEGRLSYATKEILPVVFRPMVGVKELYRIVGQSRGFKGLSELGDMEIIETTPYNGFKTTIKINDFDTIKNGLVDYIWKQKEIKKSRIAKKFDKRLGILRNDINRISEITTSICDEFDRWYRQKKMKGTPHRHLEEFMKEYIILGVSFTYDIMTKQIP
jgi:hypothetical protein